MCRRAHPEAGMDKDLLVLLVLLARCLCQVCLYAESESNEFNIMINEVVQTKGNSHLYGADESLSVRAVPPHLFFISVSFRALLYLTVSWLSLSSHHLLLIIFIPSLLQFQLSLYFPLIMSLFLCESAPHAHQWPFKRTLIYFLFLLLLSLHSLLLFCHRVLFCLKL